MKILEYCYDFDMFQDIVVEQNRKGACGRQKEEILSQLGELIKLEPDLIHGEVDAAEPQKQFGNLSTGFERDIETNMFPSYEVNLTFHLF